MIKITQNKIPVFVMHLEERIDRLKHIQNEFSNRDEFNLTIVNAIRHKTGAIGVWKTIQYILKGRLSDREEYIILCEDDHQFTDRYSSYLLNTCIHDAQLKGADILSGGVSGFSSALPVSQNLFWVETFSGLQFTVIFKKFFPTILNATFGEVDAADYKLCSLTGNKFFIYPFLSIQKDFGYSDATPKNNKKGRVDDLFSQSQTKVKLLQQVDRFYLTHPGTEQQNCNGGLMDDITLPTYVINLPEQKDRRKFIAGQFKGKKEFSVNIMKACRHKTGAVGLWRSIQKIIQRALKNRDDVILICEDDHQFTVNYRRKILLESILQAHHLGCNILCGGIGGFNLVLPVTNNLYWVDSFWCTQFIVVFRKFFEPILNESFSVTDTAESKLSEMTSHKLVLYPFISIQHGFAYSDVTQHNDENPRLIGRYFENTARRLSKHQKVWEKYRTGNISKDA